VLVLPVALVALVAPVAAPRVAPVVVASRNNN
jgi:hypothetical protein